MITRSKRIIGATTAMVVASFALIYFLFWAIPGVLEGWDSQIVDRIFVYRTTSEKFRPQYDSMIIHVDVTDKTLQQLKNQYLTRVDYATVIRNLADLKVSAQMWDYFFPARTSFEDDTTMIGATAYSKNTYIGAAFKLSRSELASVDTSEHARYLKSSKWSIKVEGDAKDLYYGFEPQSSFEELAKASRGTGYLNVEPDRDGVIRRIPLLVHYDGGYYPSAAFRTVCDYLGVAPGNITLKPGEAVILKGAHKPGTQPHDITIPIDKHGNIIVSFIGPWEAMRHYDFAIISLIAQDQDEMAILSDEMAGRIAIVDQVTTGSGDVGPVPTDPSYPLAGVHANIMHTILEEDFFEEASQPLMFGIEFVLFALILLFSLRFSSIVMSLGTVLLLALYVASAVAMFLYGHVIFNILRPSLMIATSLLFVVAYRFFNEEKQKEVLRSSFEAYFPPALVKKIMANPEMITSAGQKKELTILFSDVKGFTAYSALVSPDVVQQMLNEYFDAMSEIVFKHGGTLDKFMGDGLMVFFGDPESQPDHALRCVRSAIEMQQKAREIRYRWEAAGKMPLEIRIGINTGKVIVGNMGSKRRLSYTVLGSNVNLAQRLEANAPVGGILISQQTQSYVKDHVPTKSLGEIQVKGLDRPVSVYEVPVDIAM